MPQECTQPALKFSSAATRSTPGSGTPMSPLNLGRYNLLRRSSTNRCTVEFIFLVNLGIGYVKNRPAVRAERGLQHHVSNQPAAH